MSSCVCHVSLFDGDNLVTYFWMCLHWCSVPNMASCVQACHDLSALVYHAKDGMAYIQSCYALTPVYEQMRSSAICLVFTSLLLCCPVCKPGGTS